MARRALWAGWFSLRVPCVPKHRLWVHLQRSWSFCRTVVVGLGSCAFAAFFLFAGFQDTARGWFSFGFTVLCICALVAWEQFVPPAFTVFVRAHGVSYEFRDRSYAAEFAALNGAVPATAASAHAAASFSETN